MDVTLILLNDYIIYILICFYFCKIMRVICDAPGQTCNRLWSYLASVAQCIAEGKKMVIIYPQDQPNEKYNFTICPTEDKNHFIDINGNVIVCGRADDDRLIGVQLTEDELKELFRCPYEL